MLRTPVAWTLRDRVPVASIDLKKAYKDHYSAKIGDPVVVDVPPRPYLMVDGTGDPNSAPAYREAVESLYPLAYALRAAITQATGEAYTVMPLEGLWWVDDYEAFSYEDRSGWQWTSMICLPDATARVDAAAVVAETAERRQLPAGHRVRIERFGDGTAAQVLHVGPYSEEPPTIEALHRFILESGHSLSGKHHEIYLSDPRKADPAKLRTILRQPFEG
jgi:hypothetical protein